MSGDVLSPEDRAYFLELMRRRTNSAVHRRMNVLLLLDDGWSVQRVCEALFIDDETVRDHRRLYKKDGRSGVERLVHSGGTGALRRDQMTTLATWIDDTVPQTSREVCAFVKGRFDVAYTRDVRPHSVGCTSALRRRARATTAVHPCARSLR